MTRYWRGLLALALTVAIAGVLTACGGDDKDSGSGTASAASGASGSGGKGLDGDPVKIWVTEDATGAPGAIDQMLVAAKAAGEYINKDLGGFGGRPVEITTCDTKNDPAATLGCVNKLVADKALIHIGLSGLLGANGMSILERAGIPSMNAPTSVQDYSSPNNFPIGGGGATEFPAVIFYLAKFLHAKSAVYLISDTPTGHLFYKGLADTAKRFGMTVSPVYFNANNPDITPSAAKAVAQKPEWIILTSVGTTGLDQYKALVQQGFPSKRIFNTGQQVDDETFFSKAPAGLLDGTYYTYEFISYDNPTNPDVKAYREAMKKYAPNEGKAEFYQWGFSDVMTVYNAAKAIGFDKVNSTNLKEYFTQADGVPIFMGYQASRSAAPKAIPAIFNPYVRVVKYEKGKLLDVGNNFFNAITGETAPARK